MLCYTFEEVPQLSSFSYGYTNYASPHIPRRWINFPGGYWKGGCHIILHVPAQDVPFFHTRSHLSALQTVRYFSQYIFSLLSFLKNS